MAPRPVPYNEAEFPRAKAPALPAWSPAAWGLGRSRPAAGVLSLPHGVHLHSGRYAISLALAHAGLKPGDKVLLPAYHCLAMVEPLRLAGLEPVYYPIRPDLGIDPERVEACLGDGVKALLVVHYFGFVQDLGALRHLADRHGMVLVEDCAHTLFGRAAGLPVGTVGDYAIASTMKFFALGDGGVLASARRDLADIRLAQPPLRVEVEAAVHLLGGALEFGRLGAAGRLLGLANAVKGRVRQWLRRPRRTPAAEAPGAGAEPPEDAPEYAPEYAMETPWLRRHGTRIGRFLLDHARMGSLATRRRAFYSAYLRALAGRGDCRPLFSDLPAGVVPQVFPLHVTHSLPVFVELKRQGIPIIRFGEFLDTPVDAALCPVSLDYAEHVLQFPCHQELLEAECAWIIDRLVAALNRALAASASPPTAGRE